MDFVAFLSVHFELFSFLTIILSLAVLFVVLTIFRVAAAINYVRASYRWSSASFAAGLNGKVPPDGIRATLERIKMQRCKVSGSLKYPAVVSLVSSRGVN